MSIDVFNNWSTLLDVRGKKSDLLAEPTFDCAIGVDDVDQAVRLYEGRRR